MRRFLTKWIINSLAILIVTYIVKGIQVASPLTAIVVALVLGIINAFLRPFIIFTYRYFFKGGFLDGYPGLIYHFWQGFWYRMLVDINIFRLKLSGRRNFV